MAIVSVHIPETSGAAFGAMLREYFGERMCFFYYEAFDHNHSRIAGIPEKAECLHGHFPARSFLDRFPAPMLVTWVREAVDRVASEYEVLKRNPDARSSLSQLITLGADLLEFAEHEYARNTQARYFDGLPIGRFAFVGLSERFESEVYRFGRIAGVHLPLAVGMDANEARLVRHSIPESSRKRILELNAEDVAIYESARRVWESDPASRRTSNAAPAESGDSRPQGLSNLGGSYARRYSNWVARLQEQISGDSAMEAAVGGEFLALGMLEYSLLRSLGLNRGATVIDVGCGSGRLALPLSSEPEIRYVGTDVVPQLLEHARKITGRNDWRFELTEGLTIPVEDETADFVCFFSVLTHLTHEDSFRYLREARRVLKSGGKIVLSFLEFYRPSHWSIFEKDLRSRSPGDPLNQFIERDALRAWAYRLGLVVNAIHDGDKPHIPLDHEIKWQNGRVMKEMGNLGQSVAVLGKP